MMTLGGAENADEPLPGQAVDLEPGSPERFI